ncbi:CRISPR-associated protein Cas4 [Prolixibacter sp. SD074]|uniref:CRISPR-associated protein Cas4 n=1 Tax=Prolixibacter sp. SD074 TaxID=2652391 RepID=UPI0012735CEB|nr:CRISPR-associated protein Cas4 [Prolixibacter sp. SD074]GET29443.1 CRISPR-associated protein Cas4 [Prolixibacter sp. SD074]
MQVTGTHIHYYFNCHRQLWLFANSINMEQSSDTVYEGKLIHETSYTQRTDRYKEVEIGPVKIDYFDHKDKVIHEIKKSSQLFVSHKWQVKYYIYLLEQAGVEGVTGILEYPKEHKTEEVLLSEPDRVFLCELLDRIEQLIHQKKCPPLLNKPRCKNCSYYDFCYSGEEAIRE